VADTRPRATPIVTKPVPWHWWVTIDLLCSSLGAGLFSIAAILHLFGNAPDRAVAWVGFIVDFPVMLVDLVCLVFDLGDPYRFMNMLRVFKPGSPMSVGVWTIAIFSFASFCAFAVALLGLGPSMLSIVAVAGLPFALMVGIYKGVLFSTTAQPGWRAMRWLGASFSVSAAVMGIAALLVIAAAGRFETTASLLRELLLITMIFYALTLFLLERGADEWTRAARKKSRTSVVLGVVGGLLLPIIVIAFSNGPAGEDCGAALLILGAIAVRHVLVIIPHRVAAN
jgi:Ni/Fe-hydrogenase subunit HybB-like protein